MVRQKQPIEIPIFCGLNTKSDAHVSAFGEVLTAENVSYTVTGAVEKLPMPNNIPAVLAGKTWDRVGDGNLLIGSTDNAVDVITSSPTTGGRDYTSSVVSLGPVCDAMIRGMPLEKHTWDHDAGGIVGGYRHVCTNGRETIAAKYERANGICLVTFDGAGRKIAQGAWFLDKDTNIVALSDRFGILYYDSVAAKYKYNTVLYSTLGTLPTLTSGHDTGIGVGAVTCAFVTGSGRAAFIVARGGDTEVIIMATPTDHSPSFTKTGERWRGAFSVLDGATWIIAYGKIGSGSLFYANENGSAATRTADTLPDSTVSQLVGYHDTTIASWCVAFSGAAGFSLSVVSSAHTVISAVLLGTTTTAISYISCAPWSESGKYRALSTSLYGSGSSLGSFGASILECDGTSWYQVGATNQPIGFLQPNYFVWPIVVAGKVPLPLNNLLSSESPTTDTILSLCDLSTRVPRTVITGGSTFLNGGVMTHIDGSLNYFKHTPIFGYKFTQTPSATGGYIAAGYYYYKLTFQNVDSSGGIYRHPVSAQQAYSPGAGSVNSNVISITPLHWEVGEFVLYRTEASGANFYRVGSIAYNGVPTATPLIITDTYADLTISIGEELYTDSGEIESDYPGNIYIAQSRRDRLFAVSYDDQTQVLFSKTYAAGYGVEFYYGLGGVQTGIKEITAIGVIDDRVIVFGANTVRYFGGDGPDALGNGNFSPCMPISDIVGCESQDSIQQIDQGLLFKSARGFYLLDHGMTLTYVGQGAQLYDKWAIVDSFTDRLSHRVWFTLSYPANASLIYDTEAQTWSIMTDSAGASLYPPGLVQYPEKYYIATVGHYRAPVQAILQHSGTVNKCGVDYTSADSVARYPTVWTKIRTPWVKLGGQAGDERLYELVLTGSLAYNPALGVTDLFVKIYFDYDLGTYAENVESHTILATDVIEGLVNGSDTIPTPATGAQSWPMSNFRLRLHPNRHRGTSFMIEISEYQFDALRITGLTAVVGVKSGVGRVRASQYK